MVDISLLKTSEKMATAIMALIANRKKLCSKGIENTDGKKFATFSLGDSFIKIGERGMTIADRSFKLPKQK